MALVTIRGLATPMAGANGSDVFPAQISFAGEVEYPIVVRYRFAETEEVRLEWSFEERLRQPFLSGVIKSCHKHFELTVRSWAVSTDECLLSGPDIVRQLLTNGAILLGAFVWWVICQTIAHLLLSIEDD